MNRYEYAAREEKARKIAATAREWNYTADAIRHLSDEIDWPELGARAGLADPYKISAETKARVLALIEGDERVATTEITDDIFEGL